MMVNGYGELDLDQVKELTDAWSIYSDMRPLVAARLWKEVNNLKIELARTKEELDITRLDLVYAQRVCTCYNNSKGG